MTTLLYGPTASGKTAFALAWVQQTGGNIISADARQVYQDMNVVVGKDIPPGSLLEGTPEGYKLPPGQMMFGLDLVPPTEIFSLSHWYNWVEPVLKWHQEQGVPCLVVGGTWQWLEVLISPPKSLFVPPDEAWRTKAETLTIDELQAKTQQLAPDRWTRMNASDQSNSRRLIRAIEVARAPDSVVPSTLLAEGSWNLLLRDASIDDLTASIQGRVLDRWHNGALEETRHLMNTYPDWSAPAFSASGYPALRAHLEKKVSVENTIQKWTWAERQYAKRQRTWIKLISEKYSSHLEMV